MTGGLRWLGTGVLVASLVALGHSRSLQAQGEPAAGTGAGTKPAMMESKLEVTGYDSLKDIEASQESGKWPWVFVFEGPARFERLGFDQWGMPVPREALTIYEGMTVWVDRDGRYKVRFRADVPLAPAVVRLQLNVREAGEPRGTITLPPVHIKPTQTDDGTTSTQPFLVTYSGTSDVLRRLVRNRIASQHAHRSAMNEEWERVNTRHAAAKNSKHEAEQKLKAARAKQEAIDVRLKETEARQSAPRTAPKIQKGAAQPSPAKSDAAESPKAPATSKTDSRTATLNEGPGDLKALEREQSEILKEVNEARERLKRAELSLTHATAAYNATKPQWEVAHAAAKAVESDVPSAPWSLKDHLEIEFERQGTARFGSDPKR